MGYRIVRFNSQIFAELFTEGRTFPAAPNERLTVVKGLPAGAFVVDALTDFACSGAILVKFSHPSWEDEPGAPIRMLEIQTMTEVGPHWLMAPPPRRTPDGEVIE